MNREFPPIPANTEAIGKKVLDAAFAVHKALGPGLLERVYEACLELELRAAGLHVKRQQPVRVVYRTLEIEPALRIDLLVEKLVVVEIKAVERILPVHEAQLLTYLKLSGHRLGFLMNFNVPWLKDGISRLVL